MSTILYKYLINMYSLQENLCKKNPLTFDYRRGKIEVYHETIKIKKIELVAC